MATLAELQSELAKLNAAIDRVTGTTTAGGAQDVGLGGVRVARAPLEALYKRKKEVELSISRLSTTDGEGGIARSPIFGPPSAT